MSRDPPASVTLFDAALPPADPYLRAGDAFVTPMGFTGTWEVLVPARKYFAIYK